MEVKIEPKRFSMSPIKPIRSFSVAILNQRAKTADIENNNQLNSIKQINAMKTIHKK